MFAGWGSWVARFRWPVLSVALVAVIGAGVWGLGVFGQLSEGGYNDPHSESTRASDTVREAFGARGGDLVVIYTPGNGTIDDGPLGKRVRDRLAALPRSAVTRSTSYWNQKSPQYAAKDRSSAIAVITLAGADDAAKLKSYRAVDDKFAVAGATVQLSGGIALADASSSRSTQDLGTAEMISLPITLILLVLIFGSVVAASLPVLVGGAAVLGSLGVLRLIASVHDVNSFAVNVASLLGLGMAIDYGLFMVGRFREEQGEGRTVAEAVRRTVGTAGRTVLFSATLLMIALAGLLLFPQGFLNSLAYGGLAAVFFAAVLSLTLLPAMLAVLGPRVDKLRVRLPSMTGGDSGWARLAGFVLRRPLVVALPILAGLLLLASPARSVHFGENDERMLPAGDPARQAIETLKADYPQFTGNGVQIVLKGAGDPSSYAVAARQVPGIASLTPAERAAGVTTFTATLKSTDPYSSSARDVVAALRALPAPKGAELLVGGVTARNVDSLDATADKLPLMVVLLVGATLLLMFLAFGSILLPIKAVLMSALSLSATLGILVWIFQQGHGSSLLDVTPAPLEVGIVVLMAAVVFGLSTDYEVFLLSRMVEARTRGATTAEAVTTGLTRTGRVISAAALLLIVVTGAFALSAVTTMRFVGVGMIIALLLDATVVRMLLVPAVLSLLGDAAWWAPGPLRRLQQRAGLAEYAVPGPEARHAAPDDTAVLTDIAGQGPLAAALPSATPDPASSSVEAPALPPPATPLALPPGSSDVTAVFPRVPDDGPLAPIPLPAAPLPPAAAPLTAVTTPAAASAAAAASPAAAPLTPATTPAAASAAATSPAAAVSPASQGDAAVDPASTAVIPTKAFPDISEMSGSPSGTSAAKGGQEETEAAADKAVDAAGGNRVSTTDTLETVGGSKRVGESGAETAGQSEAEAAATGEPGGRSETRAAGTSQTADQGDGEAAGTGDAAGPSEERAAGGNGAGEDAAVELRSGGAEEPSGSDERHGGAVGSEVAEGVIEEVVEGVVEDDADLPAFGRAIAGQPGVYVSASIAAAYATDYSEPDEFFFAPSVTTFGTPVDAPAIEPPQPWELPALPAGREVGSFETTRNLSTSGVVPETFEGDPGLGRPFEASMPVRTATPEPGDNPDVPAGEPRRRDLGSAFRRADVAEIPAPRRPADLADLESAGKRPQDPAAGRGIPGWGHPTGGTPRPADLRDHLRETRPADLAQYSRGRDTAEAPRRPASLGDLPPARRPATLADHVAPSRRTEEESS